MEVLNLLHQFKILVQKHPSAPMLYDDRAYSYEEMDQLSDALAQKILHSVVSSEKIRIAFYLNHTYKIILAILAVLKTGHSYLPLNKKLPIHDVKRLLAISQAKLILIDDEETASALGSTECKRVTLQDLSLENAPKHDQTFPVHTWLPEEEIYVLFTSGSTGIPKACSINYGNINYILQNMQVRCPVEQDSVYLFSTPYSFDVSVTEIYSFFFGAKVVVYDIANYAKYKQLPQIAEEYKITHFASSPSYFLHVLTAFDEKEKKKLFSSMQYVMLAGEAFKMQIFDVWKQSPWVFRLFNLYGPTEATVYALGYELKKEDTYTHSVPLGTVFAGADYRIDQPDADNIGELILLGEGICDGYLNNIEETKKRFTFSPIKEYKTGDFVSLKDGLVFFHGRKDDQVQLNGIRVELGDIENKIRSLPFVEEVAVVYFEEKLLAHVVLTSSSPKFSKAEFSAYLSQVLQNYMLPNYVRFVDELRKNLSNKVDRKYILSSYQEEMKKVFEQEKTSALSASFKKDLFKQDKQNLRPAFTKEVFLEILRKQLQVPNLLWESDFFEAGANSLHIFNIASELEKVFALPIDTDELYLARKVSTLYENLRAKLQTDGKQDEHVAELNVSSLTQALAAFNQHLLTFLEQDEKLLSTYEALHLQDAYVREKFNSYVHFSFHIGKKYGMKDVQLAIEDLIRKNSLLRSKLLITEKMVYFEEYFYEASLPTFDLSAYPSMKFQDIEEYIRSSFAKLLFNHRYHHGYLAMIFLLKREQELQLFFLLDHCIADASNLKIIKNKVVQALEKDLAVSSLTYQDYCKEVREKNTIDILLHSPYFKLLQTCQPRSSLPVESFLANKTSMLKIKHFIHTDSTYISMVQAYLSAKAILALLEEEAVAIRTLLNIREYPDFSFAETLGDIHTGLALSLKKNESFQDFYLRAKQVLRLFTSECFRPSYVLHFNQDPRLDAYRSCVKKSIFTSSNYLGQVSEQEVTKKIDELKSAQEHMYKVTSQIYVSGFMAKDTLYLLSNKDIFSNEEEIDFKDIQ